MKAFALLSIALLAAPALAQEAVRPLVEQHCVDCHDGDSAKGKLNLEVVLAEDFTKHPAVWERVVRKLATRQMPPASKKERPTEAEYAALVAALAGRLDAAGPQPGRTATLRRLNRAEYQNAIRDLLAVEVDAAALLPSDEASHGFDNMSTSTLPPTLLDRYITAAQKKVAWLWARRSGCRAARRFASSPTSRSRSASRGCRSARGAGRRFLSPSRRMVNTKCKSASRATATMWSRD